MRLLLKRPSAAMRSVLVYGFSLALVTACGKSDKTALPTADGGSSPASSTAAAAIATPAPSLAYAAPHFPYGAYNINAGCTVALGCSDGNANDFNDPDNTIAYPYPSFAFYQNLAVSVTPSNVGEAITSCTVSPALPTGLSLSAADCSISGTPTVTATTKFYTVTATGAHGASTALISIRVDAATVKAMNIPAQSYVFIKNKPIAAITPAMTGGAAVGDCLENGSLPTGLSFAAGTCNITGTPTSAGTWSYIFGVGAGVVAQSNFFVPPPPGNWQALGTSVYLPMTVLDPSTQPFISYGGQYFGRAQLQQGVTMQTITPGNQGASITSCSIIPTLPSGLTLSQSDCSISGTPTSVSNPTTYMIIPQSGSKKGNSVTLDLSVGPAQVNAMSCQSGTLCVHSLMPLWSQGDRGLANWLSAQGYNVGAPPADQGWCGGVSSAMIFWAYFSEISKYSNIQSVAWQAPFSSGDSEYTHVLNAMKTVNTDIPHGGTIMPNSGFNSVTNFCSLLADNFTGGATSVFAYPSEYSHGMPMGWLSVHGAGGADPHALALNGVEGGFFKIYDPWGAVYNATLTWAANGTAGTLTWVEGTSFNEISFNNGGVVTATVQWIKDYVNVSGAGPVYRCQ